MGKKPHLNDPIRRNLLLKTAGAWLGSAVLPAGLLASRGWICTAIGARRDHARWRPAAVAVGLAVRRRGTAAAPSSGHARTGPRGSGSNTRTTHRLQTRTRVRGLLALETSDHIARVDLRDLPADRELFVRVTFEDLGGIKGAWSEPATGTFRTAPQAPRDVRFVWSGDTAGQGFGINPDFGGMRIYEAMRKVRPDFFLHSGDTIYADGPIMAEQKAEDGRVWKNIVTEEVSKVAETLKEFRGRYAYNLMDENVRRFAAEVPQV